MTPSPRIVVVGGGFAGAYTAAALQRQRRHLGPHAEILLIDRHNYFAFSPLLVEAGTGSLEPRHTVVPLRRFLKHTTFRMGDVKAFDFAGRTITYQIAGSDEQTTVPYDHLVMALGSVTRMPPVPGLREHGLDIKNMGDAIALRDRAVQLLEQAEAEPDPAKRPEIEHLVIVGGNFTGVEVAGEFWEMLRRGARYYSHVNPEKIKVTLVERGPRLLTQLDESLGDYAAKLMTARGIDIRLNASATEVGPNFVTLDPGGRIATRTVIWCAGIAPSPVIANLPLPKTKQGYLDCEPTLRVKGFENVWAVGDIASIPDPHGQHYPATAQHAVREGKLVAKNIVAALDGRPLKPFVYRSQGSLASLGGHKGIAKVWGMRFSGFIGWWLWRSVYLLKMPGLGRKLQVMLDWTLALMFPPDFVQIGAHRQTPRPDASPATAAPPPRAAPTPPPPPAPSPAPATKSPREPVVAPH